MRKFPVRTFISTVKDTAIKWTIPAPPDIYSTVNNLFVTLEAFMRHCNVTVLPDIQMSLF
ncbi:MAG: hypothetical protein ACR2JB_22135 [Bryobacteraceae bacterium]